MGWLLLVLHLIINSKREMIRFCLTNGSNVSANNTFFFAKNHRKCYHSPTDAGWSSPVARWAHNPKVAGSNPAPATKYAKGSFVIRHIGCAWLCLLVDVTTINIVYSWSDVPAVVVLVVVFFVFAYNGTLLRLLINFIVSSKYNLQRNRDCDIVTSNVMTNHNGMAMNNIQDIATIISNANNPMALATLVQATGSSYRRPGARMIFDHTIHAGTISAGCLETDILAQIESVVTSHSPQLATYDMGSDLDLIWGTGMGCQGQVKVLLERVAPKRIPYWISSYVDIIKQRQTGAMATIFAITSECNFANIGDHFLYNNNDKDALLATEQLTDIIKPVLQRTNQQGIASVATVQVGKTTLDLLSEPILPPFALWIFGGGEHARPIANLAKELGWFVGIVDYRPALATQERFPYVDRIIVGQPRESLASLPLDQRSAVLIISHVYEQDQEALKGLMYKPVAYLGLQGNRKRSERLLKELVGPDMMKLHEKYQNLHFPAGLDIGAETPEAIAVSMVAEIQAKLTGHKGGSLRDREGLIH